LATQLGAARRRSSSWQRSGAALAAAAAVVGVALAAVLLAPEEERPSVTPLALPAGTSSPTPGTTTGTRLDRIGAGTGTAGGAFTRRASAAPAAPTRAAEKPAAGSAAGPVAAPAPSPVPSPAQPAGPVVAAIDPASGPWSGGNTVTLRGSGFTPDAVVSFGSVPASEVEVVSPTELRVVVPASLPGEVVVTVSTAAGTSPPSSGSRYRYVA
jgi:hypothetical protein